MKIQALDRCCWIGMNNDRLVVAGPNCLYLSWDYIKLSGKSERDPETSIWGLPGLRELITGAIQNGEFFALTDFLLEQKPDHPVTQLLLRMIQEDSYVKERMRHSG